MPAQIPEVGGIPMTISAIPREARDPGFCA